MPPKSTYNPIVTVSMGIFPKDGGLEAPAAVVGFQMPMKALLARFKDITSRTNNENLNCALEWMHCYLIDQNGYIVLAEADFDPVGDFLGIVHGPIMQSLVLQGIFSPVEIYDYQAFCENIVSKFCVTCFVSEFEIKLIYNETNLELNYCRINLI